MATSKVDIEVSASGAEAAAAKIEGVAASATKMHQAAGEAASGGLKALNEASSLVQERTHEMAAELGAAGQVISALGPIGIAAAAGLAVMAEITREISAAFSAAELNVARIQGVLQATGNQAGLTANQLKELAVTLSQHSLFNQDEILKTEAVLTQFGGVTGDVFERTMKAAVDLASTGIVPLETAITKLGLMAQAPAENLDKLKRSGIELDASAKEVVKSLDAAGDKAGAFGIILQQVEARSHGTADAMANTLAGASHKTKAAFEEMLEQMGKNSLGAQIYLATMEKLAGFFESSAAWLDPIKVAQRELADLEAQLKNPAPSDVYVPAAMTDAIKQRIAQLHDEIEVATLDKEAQESFAASQGHVADMRRGEADAAEKQRQADEDARLEAEKRAALDKAVIDQLKVQVDSDQRLTEAYKAGQDAFQQTKRDLQVEIELRKLSVDGIKTQSQAVIDLITAGQNARDELKHEQDLSADAQATLAQLQQDTVDAATTATDTVSKSMHEQQKAVGDFSQRASGVVIQSFADMATGARSPLDALKSYAISTFEQIAAAAIIRPMIQASISGLAGGGGDLAGAAGGLAAGSAFSGAGVLGGLGASTGGWLNSLGASNLGLSPGGLSMGGDIGYVPISGTSGATATLSGVLGAGALGAVGGNLLATLTHMRSPTNASIGGGLGASVGMLAGGPIGAAIGGLLGSLAGLFGPKPSDQTEGYFTSALGDLPMAQLGWSPGDAKYSSGNDQAAKSASQGIISFVQQLKSTTGASFNFAGGPGFGVKAGSRDGVSAQFGSDQWQSFGSVQDLTSALVQWVVSGVSGVPDDVMTALKNIDFAGDMQGGISKLQVVEDFLALQKQIADTSQPVSQVEATWTATHDQIAKLATQVEALGISADEATKMTSDFDASFRANYLKDQTATLNQVSGRGYLNDVQTAITAHATSLRTDATVGVSSGVDDQIYGAQLKNALGSLSADQLANVAQVFADVPEVLAAVGVASKALAATAVIAAAQADPLALVNKLYSDRISKLNDEAKALQGTASAWTSVGSALAAFNASLPIDSSLSPYGLGQQVGMAQGQLQDLFTKGMAGDSSAAAQFPAIAKQFLTLDKQFNASNSTYASDFAMVQDMTSRLQAFAGTQVSVAQQQLGVLQQILGTLQGGQAAASGKSVGGTPYSAAYAASLTSSYTAARAASGMSDADFLNSASGSVWIAARDDLIANTTDPGMLSTDLTNARAQASQPGLGGVGGGYVQSVIAQMNKLGQPLPQFAAGGPVMSTGLAVVHQGEYVASNDHMSALIGEIRSLRAAVTGQGNGNLTGLQQIVEHLQAQIDLLTQVADIPHRTAVLAASAGRTRMLRS